MRNVLVVSTVEHLDEAIRPHLDHEDAIKVVVPVVRQNVLGWLANDQRAFEHAGDVAQDMRRHLRGHVVAATPGEADVGLAVRDALATFAADEILIALRPEEERNLVEAMATGDAPRRAFEGIPVRRLVVSER